MPLSIFDGLRVLNVERGNKMKTRKILATLLVCVMIVCAMTATVFAADANASATVYSGNEAITTIENSTLAAVLTAANTYVAENAVANAKIVVDLYNDSTANTKAEVKYATVINGKDNTVTYTGSDRAIDAPAGVGDIDVVINDLTVNCTANYCQRGINYNTTGSLELNNVTVKGNAVTYALNLPGSADNCEVNVNNSELSGNIAINIWGSNNVINVNNSTLNSIDNAANECYGAIVLNNDSATIADNTVVNVTGGVITANDDSFATINYTATSDINISDSTDINVEGEDAYFNVAIIVKYAGEDAYYGCESLAEAVAVATGDAAATIALVDDIVLNEEFRIDEGVKVTIDLNGNDINAAYQSGSTTKHYYAINNFGNLTIKDSVGGGSINARGIYNGYVNNNTVTPTAVMTIESGIINGIDVNGGYAVGNYGVLYLNGGEINVWEDTPSDEAAVGNSDATALYNAYKATLNGGTLNSTTNFTYAIDSKGTLIIPEDSKVKAYGAHGALYVSGGEATVDGGEFYCTADYAQSNHVIYAYGSADVTINGGTFEHKSVKGDGSAVYLNSDNASLDINGGNFVGMTKAIAGNANTTVSGGTFNKAIDEKYLADGFEISKNEDGSFGVKKEEVVEEEKFKSLLLYVTYPETYEDTEGNAGAYKLHMFSAIDSLNYKEVGFDIYYNGQLMKNCATNVVFKTVTTTLNGVPNTVVNPTLLLDGTGKYIYGYTLYFGAEWDDLDIKCVPYYVTKAGKKVPGYTFEIGDVYPETIEG